MFDPHIFGGPERPFEFLVTKGGFSIFSLIMVFKSFAAEIFFGEILGGWGDTFSEKDLIRCEKRG